MIDFKCLNCGKKLSAKDEHAGRKTSCPKCKHQISVPSPYEEFNEFEEESEAEFGEIEHNEEIPETFTVKSRSLPSELKEEIWQKSGMPRDIEELISPSETVLFSGNPVKTVLYFKMVGALLTGLIIGLPIYFVGVVITVPLFIYMAYIAWKNQFYVITSQRVITRSGWFNRKISLAPVINIQSVSINTGVIDRWLGLNTVHFLTAASSGFFSTGSMSFKNVDSGPVLRAFGASLVRTNS
jgi:membrane protein YdbS with pleckstrin-like domain/DNA-directed RNA polymerase subunit RPC12/RpoP